MDVKGGKMEKIIGLLILAVLINGCVTTSSITPNLAIGMTKQEVIAKCGKPMQAGAVKDKDGRILESFMYREILSQGTLGLGGYAPPVITYVYFADGKVVYYGNPNPPTEPSRQGYAQPAAPSSDNSYLMQEQIDLQRKQQMQQQMQQQTNDAWNRATQATQDAMKRNQIPSSTTNCYTKCDNFGNCNTNCQ